MSPVGSSDLESSILEAPKMSSFTPPLPIPLFVVVEMQGQYCKYASCNVFMLFNYTVYNSMHRDIHSQLSFQQHF